MNTGDYYQKNLKNKNMKKYNIKLLVLEKEDFWPKNQKNVEDYNLVDLVSNEIHHEYYKADLVLFKYNDENIILKTRFTNTST
jgi:hypothetical protein